MKSLEKDRTHRYETANAMALDVQRHLDDEPVQARAPKTMYRLQKYACRHRSQIIIVTVIAVLIIGMMFILSVWNQNRLQLAEAESLKHKSTLFGAREAFTGGDLDSALEIVKSILLSENVGSEARLLHAQIVLDLQGPTAAVQELEALLSNPEEIPEEVTGKAHFLLAKIYYDSDPDALGRTEEYRLKWEHHHSQAEKLLPMRADAYLLKATSASTVHHQKLY